MSLSESVFGEIPDQPRTTSAPFVQFRDIVEQLTDALAGLLTIQNVQRANNGRTPAIVFQGTLSGGAVDLYPTITERFRRLGYTAMLERNGELDVVIALEGLLVGRRVSSPGWLHLALLGATIVTTILSGAQFQGKDVGTLWNELTKVGNFGYLWTVIQAGAPFSLTLLLILGVHEMGHYFAARRHGVDVTLPYFIPLPFINLLGTLGAVIFIKSPLTNRKSLFDVGISGPLAGFVVALVAFIISMGLPTTGPNVAFQTFFRSDDRLGMPILLQLIGNLAGKGPNLARFVAEQPIALAAWFGMLLTVLNLLPIGQLDGGHVIYTLFGRFAWTIATFVFAILMFLSLNGNPTLFVYALLALLTGLRHPPPNNDITPLDRRRRILGYATLVLFFLIGTLNPFPIF